MDGIVIKTNGTSRWSSMTHTFSNGQPTREGGIIWYTELVLSYFKFNRNICSKQNIVAPSASDDTYQESIFARSIYSGGCHLIRI